MLRNYITVALRNLSRHKVFSFINIVGLAIGLACSILILLWVSDELSYDRSHSNAHDLYRLTAKVNDREAAITSLKMAPALQAELPVVKAATRVKMSQELVLIANRKFEEKRVVYADAAFLTMFSFPFAQGDLQRALTQPNGVVITRQTALKYFGTSQAVGKTIQILQPTIQTTWVHLLVTGVLQDIPANSHLQFDLLLPYSRLYGTENYLKNDAWDSFTVYTYLQLNGQSNPTAGFLHQLEGQINQLHKGQQSGLEAQFMLQPLLDIHLRTKSGMIGDVEGHGNEQYVHIFSAVAIVVLLIACINFMNLATARASRRAKEVGLRKVIGAQRGQLIGQFLGESFLFTCISVLVALLLVKLFLPLFNSLTQKQLLMEIVSGNFLWTLVAMAVLTALLAGSYPALYLSSFQPIKVLKGKVIPSAGSIGLRNSLVVFQFIISLILMIGTAVVYSQLEYIKNQDLGFNKQNLLYVPMPRAGDLYDNTQALQAMLSQYPETNQFSIISDLPTNLQSGKSNFEWEGKDPTLQNLIPYIGVDEHFIETLDMRIVKGRNFRNNAKTDQDNFLINETAVKLMGYENETAIGKSLSYGDKKGYIIGIIKDFHFKPIHQTVEPLVLRFNKFGGYILVRTQADKVAVTVSRLETIFGKTYPNHPFSYNFIDEDLAKMYRTEQRVGRLFNAFACLAIFISCLGLFGLSAFIAEQRTKEIGIRKVLGASVPNILLLLSVEFIKPIVIALLIATPLAWYLLSKWLEDFAYRIDLGIGVFLIAGVVAMFIALLTVGFQAVKAAGANPTKSLRNE